jgi:hypothetical protein
MGNLNFDASNIAPSSAFDPLPPGWYAMRIIGAELVQSEKAGEMLKITHEIDENQHPEYAKRCVWSNLCINHPNDTPREIARRTLSAIAHAVGILNIQDTTDLLGLALRVKVKAMPAKDGYDARNEVSGYRSLAEGDGGAAPTPTSAPTKSAAPAATPSWKKR